MKQQRRLCLFTLFMLTLCGCSSLSLQIANIPANFFDGEVHEDIVFDPQHGLKLDVYVPKRAVTEPLPVVVFFYGGRWSYGEKHQYQFVATALADKGFVVVVPDYRKYPEVKFPGFVNDGAAAVQWTHENIASYNGQGSTLFISGHSAGAHIGALLVSDRAYLAGAGDTYGSIKGFAGLAGPYSFTPMKDDLVDIFGPESRYPQMQVPTFITGKEPPMLLLTGADDTTVKAVNGKRLTQAILAKGGVVEAQVYEGIDHTDIIGVFSTFLESKASVVDDVTAFFHDQI